MPPIQKQLQSSNLRQITYDPDTHVLELQFHSGTTYRYPNTSHEDYAKLMAAPSHGKHFHQHFVATKRAFERVEPQHES